MASYRQRLPFRPNTRTLCYTGIDTELCFVHQKILPKGATYPLLNKADARDIIEAMYVDLIALAKQHNALVILDAMTWIASRDRGAKIGLTPKQLEAFNLDAIDLMHSVRANQDDLPTLLSAQIGPRDDGYSAEHKMSWDEAKRYHGEQISTYSSTPADLITGSTLSYADEALGIVLAAKEHNMPVVISFTVEQDGHLPSGMSLKSAIEYVDQNSEHYAEHFMINCAHPDHFAQIFNQQAWEQRIKGIIVNASRCSHAELDNCDTLDAGDPIELGELVGDICRNNPQINVVGGCCGTNFEHLQAILRNLHN
ncbi:homocysteine S-methyltransferase family protein [Vibrio sp. 188UL20-2]|uniref:Homocysteine S-methyltransferase family protein n=1 Tax=Vibrio ulleungensis TaxID=2807619 RepID=A0ABS2HI67_9VIBR|nr:homocysteine S-methyltransferase family protein [Vibrio ulleungensis]